MVQFMGGNPVDEGAYNQLLSNGFFIQGSPELAAYKQKIEQDNRDSDRPPERDSAGRLLTRPTPKGASISELAQLISESSKGGGSILGSIPSLMGAVQGKAATAYQDQITKTLAERIANPDLAVHEVKALQALQNIWTNTDLSKKDRVEAVSKTLLYVPPSTGNMLGKKKGTFGSKNWFGYATDDNIEKLYGPYTSKNFMTDTTGLIENKQGQTRKEVIEEQEKKYEGVPDTIADIKEEEGSNAYEQVREDVLEKQTSIGQATGKGYVGGKGFRAGGLIKKPTKKKKTKKY